MNLTVLRNIAGLVVVLSLGLLVSAVADDSKPYEVDCSGDTCLVDKQTYVGWRVYHSNCHVCHAQDAVGSTFAPSLLARMKEIDKERFIDSLDNGFTGQVGVMPGWKENPNVNKKYEELYAYLMARADGVLEPGRPKRAKK